MWSLLITFPVKFTVSDLLCLYFEVAYVYMILKCNEVDLSFILTRRTKVHVREMSVAISVLFFSVNCN